MRRTGLVLLLLLAVAALIALLQDGDRPAETELVDPGRPERSSPEPRLSASTPGVHMATVSKTPPPVPKPDAPPARAKQPRVPTRGVVVDEEGKPLKGAVVHFRRRWPRAPFETRSVSDDGSFELEPLGQGAQLILMAAVSRTSFPMETVDVTSMTNAGDLGVKLVARKGATLNIEVLGFETWQTCAGTRVQISQTVRDTKVILESELDAKGRTSFSGLQEDGGLYLVHVGPAAESRCASGVWRGPGGTLRLDLIPAAPISGRVVGDARPARVVLRDARWFRFTTDVAEDGTFRVEGIAPGMVTCWATAEIIAHYLKTPGVRCGSGDDDVVLSFEPVEKAAAK